MKKVIETKITLEREDVEGILIKELGLQTHSLHFEWDKKIPFLTIRYSDDPEIPVHLRPAETAIPHHRDRPLKL